MTDDYRGSFFAPPSHVRYFGKGVVGGVKGKVNPITVRIGDLVLFSGDGFTDRLIQFGERMHLSKGHRIYATVNHAATVVSVTATDVVVQEMDGGGGRLTNLADYEASGRRFAIVSVDSAGTAQRVAAQAVASWYVNIPYGWASIVSDGIYCLTGLPLFLTVGQSVVCSASAVAAQRCLGLIPDKPDIAVMPSDLARYFDVQLKVER